MGPELARSGSSATGAGGRISHCSKMTDIAASLRFLKGHGSGNLDACERGGRGYRAGYVIITCYVFDSSRSFRSVNSVVGLFHSAGHATDDNQDKIDAAIPIAAYGVCPPPLSDPVVDQFPFCSWGNQRTGLNISRHEGFTIDRKYRRTSSPVSSAPSTAPKPHRLLDHSYENIGRSRMSIRRLIIAACWSTSRSISA